jgi:hypothetical protein
MSASGRQDIRDGPSTSIRHPRNWPNAAGGFFARLKHPRRNHEVIHAVIDLQPAKNRVNNEHSPESRPFTWKVGRNDIIAAVKRGCHMVAW